jgi:DNA repair exonuclease SbcCD nuclease subunit
MTKKRIIVVSDIHAKNEEPYRSAINKFFECLELYNNKETTFIFLGDIFDVSLPHNEIRAEITSYFKKMDAIIITGNHDTSKRNGNSLLSLKHHTNIIVYEKETEFEVAGYRCLALPHQYDMKHYSELTGEYDFVFTHITPKGCSADFGDGVELKVKAKYFFHGHIHNNEIIKKEDGVFHYIPGVPIPTRHGEQIHQNWIYEIGENFKHSPIIIPKYFTYETIEYGTMPETKDNILNIIKAPSIQQVYDMYNGYYIRKEGIQLELVGDGKDQKVSFERGSVIDKFVKYSDVQNIDNVIKNTCLKYLKI